VLRTWRSLETSSSQNHAAVTYLATLTGASKG